MAMVFITPPAGNPFPGAVAGVYGPFADASAVVTEIGGKSQFSIGYDVNGAIWYANGIGQVVRISMPPINGPNDLPTPVSNEDFTSGLFCSDGNAIRWTWASTQWVRITTEDVATTSSTPSAVSGEVFSDGDSWWPALRCQALTTGVVYQWDGAAWNATP